MASTRKKRARPSQITWFHRYLKNSVNQIFAWSPYRRESRKRALVRREYDPSTGLWVEKFKCELCEAVVPRDKVNCDHIVPREHVGEWDGWSNYIDRALEHGGPAGLQWICTTCHQIKTQEENKTRLKIRKKGEVKKMSRFIFDPSRGTSYLDQMEESINELWVEIESLNQKVQIRKAIYISPAGCSCDVTYTGAHSKSCAMYGVPYPGEGSS